MTNQSYIASDEMLKENITPIDPTTALQNILSLTGYTFKWIADNRNDIGLIADEVAVILPDLVKTYTVADGNIIKAVEYQNIIAVVIQALHRIHEKMMDA